MPRKRGNTNVNKSVVQTVKVVVGRSAPRREPAKFQRFQENEYNRLLKNHLEQIVAPRVKLASSLPSAEAGYNLFSSMAEKKAKEVNGLLKKLETTKGGGAYIKKEGRGLIYALTQNQMVGLFCQMRFLLLNGRIPHLREIQKQEDGIQKVKL